MSLNVNFIVAIEFLLSSGYHVCIICRIYSVRILARG